MSFSTTVSAHFDSPPEGVFDFVVAEDVLPKVLHRYGPIPGVVGTQLLSARWGQVGGTRIVALEDGGSLREQITELVRPRHYAYRIWELRSSLGRLIREGRGEWTFAPEDGGTVARWTYAFDARSPLAVPLVIPFVHFLFRGYMRAAMRVIERELEGEAKPAAHPGRQALSS